MILKQLSISGLAIAILASSSIASAGEIEGNVAIATDYVFRGFSQTDEEPAISGGFDYGFESGFSLGIWASNVNFGDDDNASAEIDLYGGYSFDVTENVAWDFTYVYYNYSGETDLNYSEFQTSVSFSEISLGLIYSPDYFGSDSDAFIVNADYSLGLTEAWGLDFHVGYTTTDEDDIAAPGDNYVDYSIALTTSGAGVDFALTFYGTDVDDVEVADDRVVLSIAKAF